MVDSDVPEVRLKVSTRDKDVPWYTTSIGEQLGPAARDLLEKYARLAPEEVESHIYKIVRPSSLLPLIQHVSSLL